MWTAGRSWRRYLPSGDAVCGDWYDVTTLPDGQLLVGVGHDCRRWSAGGGTDGRVAQRGAWVAFAGHQPTWMLADLSALAAQNSLDSFATAAYGRLDPATGVGSWAVAGHVPLLLLPADRPPHYVDIPSSPPLGVRGTASDHQIEVCPGDTLVLYTDGLIERRPESLDEGLDRLARVLVDGPHLEAATLANRIVAELCQDLGDDCCLLIVRRDPAIPDNTLTPRVSTSRQS